MKKNLLYFLGAILIIAVVVISIKSKSYPIASIDGQLISAEYYDLALTSGRNFYTKDPSVAQNLSDANFQAEFENELKRATLDAIIKHEIVKQELSQMLSAEELEEKINEKVQLVESDKTETTDTAVYEIFGVDWETYKEIVIRPEAYNLLLKEEIEAKELDYEIWFNDRLQNYEIEVFLSGFDWSGTNVEQG